MFTRRGFILTGGSALTAVSLASALRAATITGPLVSLASAGRPLAPALQGATHHILSGNRLADVHLMEKLAAGLGSGQLRLSLDAADEVLFDVVRSRVAVVRAGGPVAGATDYRLIAATGV